MVIVVLVLVAMVGLAVDLGAADDRRKEGGAVVVVLPIIVLPGVMSGILVALPFIFFVIGLASGVINKKENASLVSDMS